MIRARTPLALACVAASACAGSSAGAPASSGEPAEQAPAPEPAPEPAAAEPPQLTRAALDRVLRRGPGAFLRGVRVEAHFDDGAFAGWRVLAFYPGDPRFEGVDLRPGDLVTAVNGRDLERPEGLQRLFRELRTAPAIVVEGERGGEPFELRFPIVDPPEASGSPAPP